MDAKGMLQAKKACTEEQAPECQATCPVHLQYAFLPGSHQGDFDGAALLYRKKVCFPSWWEFSPAKALRWKIS